MFLRTRFPVLLALPVLALLAAPVNAQEIVVNGDFESTPNDLGWTQSGDFLPLINDWSFVWPVPTTSAWLGGYNNADDKLSQTVDFGSQAGKATLAFDLGIDPFDITTYDFLTVSLGGTVLDTIDLGDDFSFDFKGPSRFTYDVSAFTGTGPQTLLFNVTTDGFLASSALLDNISIEAVPEPGSVALLGGLTVFGAAFLRRRKR